MSRVDTHLQEPENVMGVYDNGGYTMDRYTVWALDDNDTSLVFATNASLSIWGVDEGSMDVDALQDEDEDNRHIGEEISWDDLPTSVRTTIPFYLKTDK